MTENVLPVNQGIPGALPQHIEAHGSHESGRNAFSVLSNLKLASKLLLAMCWKMWLLAVVCCGILVSAPGSKVLFGAFVVVSFCLSFLRRPLPSFAALGFVGKLADSFWFVGAALIPCAGMAAGGVSIAIQACLLFFLPLRLYPRRWVGGGLIVLHVIWAVSYLFVAAPTLLAAKAAYGGFVPFFFSSYRAPLEAVSLFLVTAQVVALPAFVSVLINSSDVLRLARRSTFIGLFLALVLTIAQHLGFEEYFINQHAFWNHLGRWTGAFSDPNAFGIVSVLAFPALVAVPIIFRRTPSESGYQAGRAAHVMGGGLGLCLLVIGLLSGSRSHLLGMGLLALVLCSLCSLRVLIRGVIFASLSLLVVWAIQPEFLGTMVPTGVTRLQSLFSSSGGNDGFFSRKVFWHAGWLMWLDNFTWGVGSGRFAAEFPRYVQEAGYEVGLWTDNSNNFYLGILAETGITGALAWIAFALGLTWRSGANSLGQRIGRRSVPVVLVLLVVGPHLAFGEVTWLVALLLASVMTVLVSEGDPRESLAIEPTGAPGFSSAHLVEMGVLLLCGLAVPGGALVQEYGLYPWEASGPGEWSRWIASDARVAVPCSHEFVSTQGGTNGNTPLTGNGSTNGGLTSVQQTRDSISARFKLRALQPGVQKGVRYHVATHDGQHIEGVLRDNGWKGVELRCSSDANEVLASVTSTSRWIPALTLPDSSDYRVLGLQFQPLGAGQVLAEEESVSVPLERDGISQSTHVVIETPSVVATTESQVELPSAVNSLGPVSPSLTPQSSEPGSVDRQHAASEFEIDSLPSQTGLNGVETETNAVFTGDDAEGGMDTGKPKVITLAHDSHRAKSGEVVELELSGAHGNSGALLASESPAIVGQEIANRSGVQARELTEERFANEPIISAESNVSATRDAEQGAEALKAIEQSPLFEGDRVVLIP